MAFPVFEDFTESFDSASTTIDTAYPATVNSGDLLILVCKVNYNHIITWDSDFTELLQYSSSSRGRWGIAYRTATGSETGNVTTTIASTNAVTASMLRFSGAEDASTQPPEYDSYAGGTDYNPNPPTSGVPTGGSKEYMFLAITGTRASAFTAYPSGYTNTGADENADVSNGWATRNLEQSTAEDPGTFTITGSDLWQASTVIIHPAAASGSIIPQVAHHSNIILG